MSVKIYSRNSIKHLFLAGLGSVCAFAILLSTNFYNIGLSPDSVGYIAAARHFLTGAGFTSYDGAPFVLQPPLYPLLLATISFFSGADPIASIQLLNAVLYGSITYFSGIIIFDQIKSTSLLPFLGSIVICVSIPLYRISLWAWSEPLFILFITLFFITVNLYLVKQDTKTLIAITVITALACMTRYIGVTLILPGVLIILLSSKSRVGFKTFHIILFLLISIFPLGLWILRNWLVSDTIMGPRILSQSTLLHNTILTFRIIISWYLPIAVLWKVKHVASWGFLSLRENNWYRQIFPSLLRNHSIIFILTYCLFLIITSTIVVYDTISDRLLSPIYIPLTIVLIMLVDDFIIFLRTRFSENIVKTVLITGIAIWLMYPIASNTYLAALFAKKEGGGYTSQSWKSNELIKYLHEHPLKPGYTIYSNDPYAIYILADLHAKLLPQESIVSSMESLSKEVEGYVVWFNEVKSISTFKSNEFQSSKGAKLVLNSYDGAIYMMSK